MARPPTTRSWPSAKPAIVAMITVTGTVPSTIRTLDLKIVAMFAARNASMKLPQCGSEGQSRPLGYVPEACSAAVKRLANGNSVHPIRRSRSAAPLSLV